MEQAEKLAQEVKLQMEYEHQKKLEQDQRERERERGGGRRSKRQIRRQSLNISRTYTQKIFLGAFDGNYCSNQNNFYQFVCGGGGALCSKMALF